MNLAFALRRVSSTRTTASQRGCALIGPLGVLLVYGPAHEIAMGIGACIIWVQHQFEDTYWAEHESWDYTTAALRG